jgi:amidophosphoribosyltransferase
MGGMFGVVSKSGGDCLNDLFYGTDYHSHLGTVRGGLAVNGADGYMRFIHDITNAQFRSKFTDDLDKLDGNSGIGVISDYEDQPLIISSHLGEYALVTVGVIHNQAQLVRQAFKKKLVQPKGLTLDQAAELAVEAGYLEQRDLGALLDAIDKEARKDVK